MAVDLDKASRVLGFFFVIVLTIAAVFLLIDITTSAKRNKEISKKRDEQYDKEHDRIMAIYEGIEQSKLQLVIEEKGLCHKEKQKKSTKNDRNRKRSKS